MKAEQTDFELQLSKLLQKEKYARINNEAHNSVRILKEVIELCYKAGQWEQLKTQITFLMNRRGQSSKAQIAMIQLAMTWLPGMADSQRTQLIETIRDVTAKKIFLEVEYARCVLMLVKTKQNDNDILQAASILQEVQVETYGSMDKREKLEFILYQMKIMLKKKDYVRFYIISKKINENNLGDDAIADLKVQFYAYMAIYHNHMANFQPACRCYRIIWETLSKTEKMIPETLDFEFSASPSNVLSNYIGFLVLQPFSQQTHKELKQLLEKQEIERHTEFHHLIKQFLAEEIVSCNISEYKPDSFELFRDVYPQSNIHLAELKRMLVQHNVRIISKYYGQLTLSRVSELIGVEKDYCEEQVCSLNNKKVISCRIDRIDDTIDFRPAENEQNLLNQWNSSINGILDLVDSTTNLIHREREVYKK